MQKAKFIFYTLVLVGLVSILVFHGPVLNYFSPKIDQAEKLAIDAAIQQIKKQVITPPPLRAPVPTPSPTTTPTKTTASDGLTVAGVIKFTNIQRQENGDLPALAENNQLDQIAEERLADMFQKQYFAHVSPSGESVETVAKSVGYDYLALGENLALGNFGGDEKVVIAWMNSPGHRANILNSRYEEIGVAVKKGIFEGESTWIAVQVFGKPLTSCPGPSVELKTKVDVEESQLQIMQSQIESLKSEIEATNKRDPHYNSLVAEYNSLVDQYNSLLAQAKKDIANYNSQVSLFNQCVSQ